MKKITLVLLTCFISAAANAVATPLIDLTNPGDTDISAGYTIIDRHQDSDTWNSTYGGYSGSDYTGYYLGTIDSNKDKESDLEALISYYLGVTYYDIDILEKVEVSNSSSGIFSVIYNDPATSGTWSTEGSTPAVAVNFYTVKASTEYSLYYVDPALQAGDWVTYHLLNGGDQVPVISHISASLVPAPVPEPATMLLFGTGLVGLAGSRIRRKKKK